jgi:hypothetical protein
MCASVVTHQEAGKNGVGGSVGTAPPVSSDEIDHSTHCETAVWRHRRCAMRTIGNRWWHPRNRSPGTGSTSDLLPEGKFHRLTTTCWSASGAGAVVVLTQGRNAAPIARPSYDRHQAAFLQQLLNIPQRQRISKIPADRTENELRFCLPPLEDRRSRSHFTILSRSQPGAYGSCNTTPLTILAARRTVFPRLAKDLFVRERPRHARDGKSEDKQPRDLNAERHNHLP